MNSNEVKVGDVVEFKSDYEQCGEVVQMSHDGYLVLKSRSERGFGGDYIGGNETHRVHVSQCWKD